MSKLVLITGASGYLGGRIAEALAKQSSYALRLGIGKQSPDWAGLFGGEVVQLDLLSEDSIGEACRDVEYIIHLAALNNIDSMADPQKALLVNGLGTLRLLQAAAQTSVQRFIYFSTAHVYGAPLHDVITEQTLPRPVHPYAITHRTAEDFVLSEFDRGNIEGIVLRLSNGVGYPLHAGANCWELLANDLCRQAVMQRELRLLSAGMQERDFMPISDAGRAVVHFMQLPANQLAGGIFNLGSGKALRVIDLAFLIAERCKNVLGFTPPIIRPEMDNNKTEAQKEAVKQSLVYSIDKLKTSGFKLQGKLEDEIDATLLFCQKEFGER